MAGRVRPGPPRGLVRLQPETWTLLASLRRPLVDSEGNLVGLESFDRLVRRILAERKIAQKPGWSSSGGNAVSAAALTPVADLDSPQWAGEDSYGEIDSRARPAIVTPNRSIDYLLTPSFPSSSATNRPRRGSAFAFGTPRAYRSAHAGGTRLELRRRPSERPV